MKSSNCKGRITFRHKNIKIFKWQISSILCNIFISIIFGVIGSFILIKIYFGDSLHIYKDSKISSDYDHGVTDVINKLNQSIVSVSSYVKDDEGNLSQNSMTGVLYSDDGYVLTNFFGLDNAEKIYIKIPTTLNVIKEAKVVGYNKDYDICLLKIDGNGYVKGNFKENISGVTHGLRLVSVSNIMGSLNSYFVYLGVVSGFGTINDGIKTIKSDINVNYYNTGGPISDMNGDIVAISSVNINDRFNSYGETSSILISSQDIIKLIDEIIASAT